MEKKLFKITIEDDGKVVKQIESDCIVAAISDPKGDNIAGVFMTKCSPNTMANAFAILGKVRREVYKSNPILMIAELSGLANSEKKSEEDVAGGACRPYQRLFRAVSKAA